MWRRVRKKERREGIWERAYGEGKEEEMWEGEERTWVYLITGGHGGQANTQTCSVLHHVIGSAVLKGFGEVGDSSAVTGTTWLRGVEGGRKGGGEWGESEVGKVEGMKMCFEEGVKRISS